MVLIDRGADCSPELVGTKAQPSSDSVLFLSAGRSRPARAARMPMHDLAAVMQRRGLATRATLSLIPVFVAIVR